MAKYSVENEKFVIRPIEEKDKEQVKALLKENKYLNSCKCNTSAV